MIYINLIGNLGNQMFEYAFARVLQKKYNQTICINSYNIEKKEECRCVLDKFKLNKNVIFESKKKLPFWAQSQSFILKILRKKFPRITYNIFKHFGIFIWHGNTYVDIPNQEHKNFYIDGYFQSEKYFQEIKDIILEEFTLKNEEKLLSSNLYNDITSDDVTCVAVRRGDYITNEIYKNIYYVCDEKYFNRALEYIKKEVCNKSFMLCSLDLKWVKDNLQFDGICYEEDKSMNSAETLIMMSKCSNFIISNSTFSWWAQYLCQNKNKKVIAPSIWFRNEEKTDIYQSNWYLIDTK